MLKNSRAAKSLLGEEVAAESLEDFRGVSQRIAGDADAIFKDGLEHLINHRRRYSWTDLCELYRRADKMIQTTGILLEDWAKDPERLPISGAVGRALSVVASPRLLYTLGNRFGLERTFSHLQVTERLQPDGRIYIEIRVPEHYEASPECFRFTAGLLEGLPCLLGLGPAKIEWSSTSHKAEYFVTPPPSETIWSRGKRLYRTIFASRRTLEELIEQQQNLNQKHKELKAAYAQVSDALAVRQRFLRVVSHELRTPLNGIVGTASLLRVEKDPYAANILFDALQQSASRLSGLVDEMLDFITMNDGAVKILPSDIDLAGEIRTFIIPSE
ncbi:MAG: histidine kinase dimerization/phospho-acceptor domain-containing protein, partial [Myxococcota bacterium]